MAVQGVPGGQERNRACIFSADPLQHGVVIARAYAEIMGDDVAIALLGQKPRRRPAAIIALLNGFVVAASHREMDIASGFANQPSGICHSRLFAVVLHEAADEIH